MFGGLFLNFKSVKIIPVHKVFNENFIIRAIKLRIRAQRGRKALWITPYQILHWKFITENLYLVYKMHLLLLHKILKESDEYF